MLTVLKQVCDLTLTVHVVCYNNIKVTDVTCFQGIKVYSSHTLAKWLPHRRINKLLQIVNSFTVQGTISKGINVRLLQEQGHMYLSFTFWQCTSAPKCREAGLIFYTWFVPKQNVLRAAEYLLFKLSRRHYICIFGNMTKQPSGWL